MNRVQNDMVTGRYECGRICWLLSDRRWSKATLLNYVEWSYYTAAMLTTLSHFSTAVAAAAQDTMFTDDA